MKKSFYLFCLIFFISSYVSANIVVGTMSYPVDTLAHFKIGPGSYYTALKLIDATKPLRVFMLEVDASNPYISFKSVLGKDSTITCERPSDMAKRKTTTGAMYIGGTNADFFVTSGQVGLPVAGCMVNGEMGLIPNSRPDIAITRGNIPFIGTKIYSGSVTGTSGTISINNINTTRSTNQLILYNSLNGKFTHTNAYGTEVLVQLVDPKWETNKAVKVKVVNVVSGVGNMSIPTGYAVLSGHGTAQTFLSALKVNDLLDINLGITMGGTSLGQLTDMVGGDRFILENGQVSDTDWAELHPRTAIGYSADKTKMYFCVVDGRSSLSVGVTTKQLADIMKSAGAYTAMNLDGGGSSCMYVKEFDVMNVGSDGTERAVANGIFAVSSAPTDATISEINAYQKTIQLPRYGVFKPKFLGYNQYGILINKDVQGVTLSCPSSLGYINADGLFVASGTQNGQLTATYNGIQTYVNITLCTEAQVSIRLDSVLINNDRIYPIEVQSIIGQNTMKILPAALTWATSDPSVCQVLNGELKGLKNGQTLVVGSLGAFKDTIKVTVEIPEQRIKIQDSFNDLASWALSCTASSWNATISNQGLPSGWNSGASILYTYKSARAPSIKMAKAVKFFSLPDTIKFTLNTGDVDISKLIMSFRANNASSAISLSYNNLPKNQDVVITVPSSSIVTTSDFASYPIWMDYMNLYINTATQVADQQYRIGLKELSLCYNNLALSVTNPQMLSKIRVFPNPLNNDQQLINIENTECLPLICRLFTPDGKLMYEENKGIQFPGVVQLYLPVLKKGNYLLQILTGSLSETIKLIKN